MIRIIRDIMSRIAKNIRIVKYRLKILHNNPTIILGSHCIFQNPGYMHFGKQIVLGDNTKLLCTDSYNGEINNSQPYLCIGESFHCTRNLTIQCAGKIDIGKNVLIASDVFIIDYDHGLSPLTRSYLDNPLKISKGIKISDGVWIGNNVVILGGVTIGNKAIIGAGSVVTHDVPEYTIAVGNPAKPIKHYDKNIEEWVSDII